MRELVINWFGEYKELIAEANKLESGPKTYVGTDGEKRLTPLEIKLTFLNAWLRILNADERFVVRKRLIDRLEWDRVVVIFRTRRGKKYARSERTLQRYQANAFKKIEAFSKPYIDIFLQRLDDAQQGGATI